MFCSVPDLAYYIKFDQLRMRPIWQWNVLNSYWSVTPKLRYAPNRDFFVPLHPYTVWSHTFFRKCKSLVTESNICFRDEYLYWGSMEHVTLWRGFVSFHHVFIRLMRDGFVCWDLIMHGVVFSLLFLASVLIWSSAEDHLDRALSEPQAMLSYTACSVRQEDQIIHRDKTVLIIDWKSDATVISTVGLSVPVSQYQTLIMSYKTSIHTAVTPPKKY